MPNQKTSPVEEKIIKSGFIPPDEATTVTALASDLDPVQRDQRLDLPPSGDPITIDQARIFFLEIKALMTGFQDVVTVSGLINNEKNLKRNWCYPGLGTSLCPPTNFQPPIE